MSLTMRCKLILNDKSEVPSEDNPLTRLTFGAVYSQDPSSEDSIYGKYTPMAHFSLNVRATNAEHLEVGKAYYVDISAAE